MAENPRDKDRQRQQNTGGRPQPERGGDRQRQNQGSGRGVDPQPAAEPDELSDISKGVTDDEDVEEERITQRTPRQGDEDDKPKQ